NAVANLRKKLSISKNKIVILYAPTFRATDDDESSLRIIESIASQLPDNYLILTRAHSNVKKPIWDKGRNEKVMDVTHCDDVQELLLISDILITDYSSIFFDFSLLERPIIFFAHDLESYEKKSRGFYINYASFVPGCVATSESELVEAIHNANSLSVNYKSFNKKYNNEKICSKKVLEQVGLINVL
ncbi:CDP-glycerol glycerophosphotransferase family protein, partial [Vibrio sp. F12]|uniref:CDP-glycerol glycerophosphotransferase family protein n=1 Tax=Vibrio sp. F12 TaxID=2070776 RepID=UPI001134808C